MKSLDNKSSMMLFNEGKDLFNEGELYEAHLKWEHIWKYGDNDSRKDIKGFIQMSGGAGSHQKKRRGMLAFLARPMELEAYGAGDLWIWRPMELEAYGA